MTKVCKRHANNPVMIYHQCVGCELEWFHEELEQKQQEIKRLEQDRDKLIECLRFYERMARGREINDGGRRARTLLAEIGVTVE